MKFLIISQFAGSPDLGMVTRNYNWGVELLKRGHEVTIVAASYSHYRNHHPDMEGETRKDEIIDGLNYIWLKTKRYDGNSSVGRIKAIINFQWRLSAVLKNLPKNYDIVIASSPHPFQIYQAKLMADKCGAKLIYDIRDLWPLTLIKIANMPRWHPFIKVLHHAENFACRNADIITSVPQNARRYLRRKGMTEDKFLPIGNGYIANNDRDNAPLLKTHADFLKRVKSQKLFIVGYCGTLGRANAMHTAIQAIAQADDTNIHLVLMGEGHQKSNLQDLVKDLNVGDRVHFFTSIPHNQISDFLSSIDVAYIGALYSRLYKYGAGPAKMNDYMAASKPIIYAVGDPRNPVEKSGCGISCRAEDSDQIAQAMDKLANMPTEKLKAMGAKGREWLLENQTIEKQMDLLLGKLDI